jgi:ABC-type transporter Mla subunit MlaD
MSTTTKPNKAAALARVQALIAGTLKRFPNGQFTLGNVVYTTSSLVQLLGSLANAMTALNTAQAAVKDALLALDGLEPTVRPVMQAYLKFLRAAFNNAAAILADFGLQPPKARTPLTSEEKAAAAAKTRATREARGTKSKKALLEVSGNVTGVTITPVIAPASPSAQASSAPSETPAANPAAPATK